jgi:hypothetical protein
MPLSIFELVTGASASFVMGAKSAGWKGDALGFSDSTGRPPPSMRQRPRRNEGGSISRALPAVNTPRPLDVNRY